MELIHNIRVEGFRSIGDHPLAVVGGMTTLVGKNSSGKSNVLRALNLFFNHEVDPGVALEFSRDLHVAPGPKAKKKRRIRVSVEFHLPDNFHFPKAISGARARLGPQFRIVQTWERDRQDRIAHTIALSDFSGTEEDGAELAGQFLNLLTYRYIPNRTVPALVLRDESRALAKSIQIRLKGNTSVNDLLEALHGAAGRLLKPIGRSLRSTGAPLDNPQVAAPGDLGELLTVTGFQATGLGGATVRDQEWGSGHQAFFLYELLCALDTHYSKFFGWKQATIWGVEEPESGLHRDLETGLARELRRWVGDLRCKLQIIATTHSPVFAMASDVGYWSSIESGVSSFEPMAIPDLVRSAEIDGVSGWIQPILAFPSNPVILVEGATDVAAFYHVAAVAGDREVRVLSLPQLDPAEKGAGKDSIVAYLKRHAGLLPNRPQGAPLVVVFDWDVSDDALQQARLAYGAGGEKRVIRMDPTYCDARLGKNFRGIERFYPVPIIEQAIDNDEFMAAIRPHRPISIAADQLAKAKAPLCRRLLATQDATALEALLRVWRDVRAAI